MGAQNPNTVQSKPLVSSDQTATTLYTAEIMNEIRVRREPDCLPIMLLFFALRTECGTARVSWAHDVLLLTSLTPCTTCT